MVCEVVWCVKVALGSVVQVREGSGGHDMVVLSERLTQSASGQLLAVGCLPREARLFPQLLPVCVATKALKQLLEVDETAVVGDSHLCEHLDLLAARHHPEATCGLADLHKEVRRGEGMEGRDGGRELES